MVARIINAFNAPIRLGPHTKNQTAASSTYARRPGTAASATCYAMAQQSHSRTTRMWISDHELAIHQAPNKTSRVPGTERKVDETNVDKTRLQTPSSGTDSALPLQAGSPWRRYKAILSLLDMGDKVIVASERAAPMSRVGVRRFPRGNQDTETLSRLREVRHANIVAALEAFQGQKILYIVFEDMHMPLDHVIRCPRRRTSDEVGTIVGQVWESRAA